MNGNNTQPIRAYIENVRDEGIGGFTIPLPTTKNIIDPWLTAIGSKRDGPVHIAIREVSSPIPELEDVLQGFIDDGVAFDELNYMAAKVATLSDYQTVLYISALEAGNHNGSIKDLINLAENIHHFDLQPAFSEAQLGEFVIQMRKDNTADLFDRLEQSEDQKEKELTEYILELETYADESAFGRGVAQQEKGVFTEQGYIVEREEFKEIYHGMEDIPKEYRFLMDMPSPMLTADDCIQDGMSADLTGKVAALKPESLASEYRDVNNQLVLCTGGFGTSPTARGRAVYCTVIYSGEEERWNRADILGVVSPENLPKWAKDKLMAIGKEQPEKPSVLGQIREAKTISKLGLQPGLKIKPHDKTGPEL